MSEAVEILIKADDQASAKLAVVATNAQNAGKKTADAFKDSGRNVKATTDLFSQLASMTGNSELSIRDNFNNFGHGPYNDINIFLFGDPSSVSDSWTSKSKFIF